MPLWFGVEFEFAVGFVYPYDAELPDETETRRLRFNLDTDDIDENSSGHNYSIISVDEAPSGYHSSPTSSNDEEHAKYDRLAISNLVTPVVQRDIAENLLEAGFPARTAHPTQTDIPLWTVDTDGSINPPYHTQYIWAPIEVISPAMEFNSENLEVVEKISCLHPIDRQKNVAFCDSIRRLSTFVSEWWEEHGQLPTVMQGVVELLKKETMFDLLTAVRWPFNDKATRYNAANLFWFLQTIGQPSNDHPRTIEFRQHEGTLAAPRVINWIRTLVGIINFVDTADPESFRYLLHKAGEERWQKEGTPKDAEQHDKFGPVPAEGSFTAIDLLQYMHLDEQAGFYSNKIHELVGIPPIRRPRHLKWDYEQNHVQRLITVEEFQRQHGMRMLWEQSLTSALAQPEGSIFNFNPDDEMWPKHTHIERVKTNHSGFTFHANDQFYYIADAVTDMSSDTPSIEPSSEPSGEHAQSSAEAAELAEDIKQLGMEDDSEDLYSAD
ncbi:hypothetical protein N431DRAFT_552712 [Stipitochalara longipes BDJ]|nr:hypothetical protein N431DRAFT_552712 [Stipitochalara longipes BDJ]